MRRVIHSLVLGSVLLLASCGDDQNAANNGDAGVRENNGCTGANCGPPDMGGADVADAAGEVDTAAPDLAVDVGNDMTVGTCGRVPAPADAARKVVVAHPFTGTKYEVLDLSATGQLTRPNVTFDMGEGQQARVQFTPDGEFGYVRQDDGSIGIFRFNGAGQPEVLQAAWDPDIYFSGIAIDSTGDNLFAWNGSWRNVGGMLYRLPLDCASGMPSEVIEVGPSKLPAGVAFLDATRLVVAADDILDLEDPNDVHIIDLKGPTRLSSGDAFPDDEAIVSGFAVTRDGRYALLGDTSFAGNNRVGIVAIGDDNSLTSVQTFDMFDPQTIVTSPFDNAAIVLTTMGDAIEVLSYSPGASPPFASRGPLAVSEASLLPVNAAMIERGPLEGMVLIAENVGVRSIQFGRDGQVSDLGLLPMGSGVEAITGALGVQP